jgi:stearoyl-CoA desaturase (delta-9 desaturase)
MASGGRTGGWFLSEQGHVIHWKVAKDLSKYPELVLLDRFHVAVAVLFAFALFGLGELLASVAPSLGTNGLQLLVWGFCISTVAAYHATYTINSLAHVWGRRRYETTDTSRNNFWLALLTLGEGWHNNHHRYPVSARQGFRPTEIDLSYLGLRMLAACGLVWNLRPVPASILEEGKRSEG